MHTDCMREHSLLLTTFEIYTVEQSLSPLNTVIYNLPVSLPATVRTRTSRCVMSIHGTQRRPLPLHHSRYFFSQ